MNGDDEKMRRSVTILERNSGTLTRARGIFMQAEIDLAFTTALNIFLELGLNKFATKQLNDRDWQIIEHYVLEGIQKSETADDKFSDVNYVKIKHKLEYLKTLVSNLKN